MSEIIALVLLGLGVFLFWFGYEVTSGKHKPDPNGDFFPLVGRNVDYVIGMSGIPMGIAMFVLSFGVWSGVRFLNYIAAGFVLLGIARAYLPPDKYGPVWHRKLKGPKSKSKKHYPSRANKRRKK